MGDNINNLPTDDYPISSGEKQIVEKFFSPIKEETNMYKDYKIPALVVGLIVFLNLQPIKNMINNLSGNNEFKSTMLKAVASGFIIYFILKIKLLKV